MGKDDQVMCFMKLFPLIVDRQVQNCFDGILNNAKNRTCPCCGREIGYKVKICNFCNSPYPYQEKGYQKWYELTKNNCIQPDCYLKNTEIGFLGYPLVNNVCTECGTQRKRNNRDAIIIWNSTLFTEVRRKKYD